MSHLFRFWNFLFFWLYMQSLRGEILIIQKCNIARLFDNVLITPSPRDCYYIMLVGRTKGKSLGKDDSWLQQQLLICLFLLVSMPLQNPQIHQLRFDQLNCLVQWNNIKNDASRDLKSSHLSLSPLATFETLSHHVNKHGQARQMIRNL